MVSFELQIAARAQSLCKFMRALLPVITSRRPDRRDRGYLAWVAVAGEVAHLPLEAAPIDGTTHVLHIYVEGFEEPLVVLAEPAGAPDSSGFPLRLAPLDDAHRDSLRAELFGGPSDADEPPPPSVRGPHRLGTLAPPPSTSTRSSTIPPPLTTSHVAALARTTGGGGLPSTTSRRTPGSLTGRTFADGRFVLEDLLGAGASGEVYRGIHTVLRRPCAVKVLHPSLQYSQDYCTRFYSEALAASQLDHRNVLRIVDYGQEPDGILYIVMELLEGRDLQQILDTEGPLPLERLVNLVSQACAGLGHAHDAGVVHRDIKPENVVVVSRKDDEGNVTELVKVCDFGIAHWVPEDRQQVIGDDDATLVKLPDSKKVVGTPAYMAPEQIRNEPVDARADVYALGVVLYELSTGRLPFTSERPMEVLMMHVMEIPKPPSKWKPDIDAGLESIILQALQKDPDKRQPNVRAVRAALRELVDDDWSQSSGLHMRVSLKNLPTASDFTENTTASLASLAQSDDRTRGIALQGLGDALRTAVSTGDVKLANDFLAWLDERFADPQLRIEEREELDRAIRVLRDPAPARAFAGQLLSGKIQKPGDATRILSIAGPVAARSLLEARRAQPPTLETRARFVTFMRATGPGSLPVVLAGLEPLTALASRSEEALAEDLLRSAPHVHSDLGGELSVRFVRADKPALAVVALGATVGFWGARANALLLGVLDSTIDVVRIAAIEALHRLGTVDDWMIERLGRILLGHSPASIELRVAAAGALALAPLESRARVVAFIHERLVPTQQGLVTSLLSKAFGSKEDPRVIVALSRALIALDPTGAKAVIDRLLAVRPELRTDIEGIVVAR